MPANPARTLGALALLTAALPANAAATAVALAFRAITGGSTPGKASPPRTVLISGGKMTKALQLARSFHAAGHRVVLVETAAYRFTGHRFSGAVDRFRVVPAPDAPGYVDAITAIVEEEGVDVYVPVCSPVASRHDARVREALAGRCEVVHLDVAMVERVDDKHRFAETAASLGLAVPDTHRITSPQQVIDFDFDRSRRPYILKSIAYDPVRRLDLTRLPRPTPAETAAFAASLPISEENPWILQEFVDGVEYCTHSTVRHGAVQLHCCCRSSAFQLNYEMVDHPEIEAWVTRFVGALGLTGQVSFDFMETAAGAVYAIECNPRTHSAITLFYDHPGVAAAYLDDDRPPIRPLASARPTYWLYWELWRAFANPRTAVERLRTVARGKEAIFDRSDPLPFLVHHHIQIPRLLVDNLRRRAGWLRIDFNIGKLVESGGD